MTFLLYTPKVTDFAFLLEEKEFVLILRIFFYRPLLRKANKKRCITFIYQVISIPVTRLCQPQEDENPYRQRLHFLVLNRTALD